MKVVITGANSAVGQAILRCGPKAEVAPESLVAAVRSERAAGEVRPLLRGADSIARIAYDDPDSLRSAFTSASAVIHLAGILVERPGSTYEQANVETTRAAVEAARQSGVAKFVLVSANFADENSSNRYWRTKGRGEALVRDSGIAYTILRAPLLLGPETEGAAALRRNAARSIAVLLAGGRTLQQPLHVDDLARAALAAARPGVADGRTLDLVGPVVLPDRELVRRAARLLGRKVWVLPMPKSLASFALALRSRPDRPGFSRDALDVITADTRLDPEPAARELGIQLTGIDDMIAASLQPGSQQGPPR